MEKQHPFFHSGDPSYDLAGILQLYLFSVHCLGSGGAFLQAEGRAWPLRPLLPERTPPYSRSVLPREGLAVPTDLSPNQLLFCTCHGSWLLRGPLSPRSPRDGSPPAIGLGPSTLGFPSPSLHPSVPGTPVSHGSSLPRPRSAAPALTRCLLPTVGQVRPLRV